MTGLGLKKFTVLCLIAVGLLAACASLSKHADSTSPAGADHAASLPILQDYPLEVGATWVYSVTFVGGRLNEDGEFQEDRWSGFITETIVSGGEVADGLVFTATLQQSDHYRLDDRVYKVTRDSVYRDGLEILRLPLQVEQEWFPFGKELEELRGDAAPGWYTWRVYEQGDVETPAGSFDDCLSLGLMTQPDHAFVWFCRDVGFVRREYHHHGTPDDRYWELYAMQKP
jgi:hypothetical protein